MLRCVRWLLVLAVVALVCGIAEPVFACPFCREALAAKDNRIPMAYMYSILFMLGMPPTVLGGIGFAIYRAFRKHARATAASSEVLLAETSAPVASGELATR